MTNVTTMTFNIDKLEATITDMNIVAKKDHAAYESKKAYIEWIKDYIEYEIVQPLEREAAQEAGFETFDADQCTNIDEARDFVMEFISDIECELGDN